MKLAAMLSLLLAFSTTAHAADKVIGLLSMPEVFWEERGPCDDQFKPRTVLIYSAPQSSHVVGDIRVDRAAPPSDVVCTVNVHLRAGDSITELPSEEYTSEQRAAIVLERRGRWFKLRLEGAAGWIQASSEDRFFPLEDLLWKHRELIGVTEAWDQRLATAPGGNLRPVPSDPRRHLIGYLTPVAQSEVEALERPEGVAPVVFRFRNDEPVLSGVTSANPLSPFVFDRRPGWFQMRRRGVASNPQGWRTEQPVWVRDSPAWKFTSVTEEAERQHLADRAWGAEYTDMRVTRFRRVGGRLWVEVELLDHSYCDGDGGESTVLRRGWMPLHDRSGEPTIRFYSRGC